MVIVIINQAIIADISDTDTVFILNPIDVRIIIINLD